MYYLVELFIIPYPPLSILLNGTTNISKDFSNSTDTRLCQNPYYTLFLYVKAGSIKVFYSITKMLKMPYFEHVMRAHQSLEKDIMLGITAGSRKKGKPRMRWVDGIKSVTGFSVNDLNKLVKVGKI